MSSMTRRTVPSRKVRPSTHYSRNAQRSIVVVFNMVEGQYWSGMTVKGAYPRFLGRTYAWSFPAGAVPHLRAPSWLDIRTRGL